MPVITIATDLSHEIEVKYQPVKQSAIRQSILKSNGIEEILTKKNTYETSKQD